LWRHICTVFIEDFLFIRNYVATLKFVSFSPNALYKEHSRLLLFLPVAIPVACTFSSTLPVASKLLNQEMSHAL